MKQDVNQIHDGQQLYWRARDGFRLELDIQFRRTPEVKTNICWWDCECQTGFIHSKRVGSCPDCFTGRADDPPDSREDELQDSENIHQDSLRIWLKTYGR